MITFNQKKKAEYYKTNAKNYETINKLKFINDLPEKEILCSNSNLELLEAMLTYIK